MWFLFAMALFGASYLASTQKPPEPEVAAVCAALGIVAFIWWAMNAGRNRK